jgi:hypothetical protein
VASGNERPRDRREHNPLTPQTALTGDLFRYSK